MREPFITFYTPTFRRPTALAACLASVQAQTRVEGIEQLVVPDFVGRGVAGMYAEIPDYAEACHGRYVHLLCDDDVLLGPTAVAELEAFARHHQDPPLIVALAEKAGWVWPADHTWPPVEGHIDLACLITRGDVWRAMVGHYGRRYEGDFDFATALASAGITPTFWTRLFVRGAVSRERPEVAA